MSAFVVSMNMAICDGILTLVDDADWSDAMDDYEASLP